MCRKALSRSLMPRGLRLRTRVDTGTETARGARVRLTTRLPEVVSPRPLAALDVFPILASVRGLVRTLLGQLHAHRLDAGYLLELLLLGGRRRGRGLPLLLAALVA